MSVSLFEKARSFIKSIFNTKNSDTEDSPVISNVPLVEIEKVAPDTYVMEDGRGVTGAVDELTAQAVLTAWKTGKTVIAERAP